MQAIGNASTKCFNRKRGTAAISHSECDFEDTALVLRARVVDVFAFRAVDLDGARPGDVGLAHGQARLPRTVDTGTPPEVNVLVLFQLR